MSQEDLQFAEGTSWRELTGVPVIDALPTEEEADMTIEAFREETERDPRGRSALAIVYESRMRHIAEEKKLRGLVDSLMSQFTAIWNYCEEGSQREIGAGVSILKVQDMCRQALAHAARQTLTHGEAARDQITKKRQ